MSDVRYIYELARGLWWENRHRSIAEAISNLVLNYILGRFFGVYGIIIATIFSLFFINFLYGTRIIFKYYFTSNSMAEYFFSQLKYAGGTLVACCVTFGICNIISDSIIGFIIKCFVCAILPNVLYWLMYHKSNIYIKAYQWVKPRISYYWHK